MKRMRINLREMARYVTLQEGGKVALPIGQVLEVQRLVLTELCAYMKAGGVEGMLAVLEACYRASASSKRKARK